MCDAVANPGRRSSVICALAEAELAPNISYDLSSAARSRVLPDSVVQRRRTRPDVSALTCSEGKPALTLAAMATVSEPRFDKSGRSPVYVFIDGNASFQSG